MPPLNLTAPVTITTPEGYVGTGVANVTLAYELNSDDRIVVVSEGLAVEVDIRLEEEASNVLVLGGNVRLSIPEWALETSVRTTLQLRPGTNPPRYNGRFDIQPVPSSVRAIVERQLPTRTDVPEMESAAVSLPSLDRGRVEQMVASGPASSNLITPTGIESGENVPAPNVVLGGTQPPPDGNVDATTGAAIGRIQPESAGLRLEGHPPTVNAEFVVPSEVVIAQRFANAVAQVQDIRAFVREYLARETQTDYERAMTLAFQAQVNVLNLELSAILEDPAILEEKSLLRDAVGFIKIYVPWAKGVKEITSAGLMGERLLQILGLL